MTSNIIIKENGNLHRKFFSGSMKKNLTVGKTSFLKYEVSMYMH